MNRVAVGCDISKQTIDICIRTNPEQYFKISNNREGFEKLLQRLPNDCHVCMEATGNYYEELADFLVGNGVAVSVVNALKISYFSKSLFNRTKTDKRDAFIIALYCEQHRPNADYQSPTDEQYKCRRLLSYLKQLNKQKSSIQNRIQSCKDEFVKSMLKTELRDVNKYIKTVNKELSKINSPSLKNIESIPSIGKTTAITLSHYLNLYTFRSAKQFIAFCGLAPQKTQSGTSVNKPDYLSSLGNRILKGSLYMPAVVAYRLGVFKSLANRLEQKGKRGKHVIVAIMRKLAALAWVLHTKGEVYRTV